MKWFMMLCFLIGGVSMAMAASGRVCFKDACYVVDVAGNDEDRARGFMYRERIEPGQGIFFIFDSVDIYGFWMKNVKFALDIIWLDEAKRVVYIQHQAPPCSIRPCPVYEPPVVSKYVVEIPPGDAGRLGIKVGDEVSFTPAP
ncbi:MAG: DUF192 domain-containing protein [Candidatus Omnitrophica bacterium]|nr:DUF192 domain-containing protein [Candidatus Omnitrophota bacterium]